MQISSDFLLTLSQHYLFNRRVGHTTTMLDGVKNTSGDVIIVAHTMQYARELKRMCEREGRKGRIIPVSISDTGDRIRGLKAPLVIDNQVLANILLDAHNAVRQNEDLKAMNILLEGHLQKELERNRGWTRRFLKWVRSWRK